MRYDVTQGGLMGDGGPFEAYPGLEQGQTHQTSTWPGEHRPGQGPNVTYVAWRYSSLA